MSKLLCESCANLSSVAYKSRVKPYCTALLVVFPAGIKPIKSCKSYDRQMTRKEVVEMRGIAYSTLYEWIDDGLLRTYKKKRPYFKKSDVENYKPKKVGRPRSVSK